MCSWHLLEEWVTVTFTKCSSQCAHGIIPEYMKPKLLEQQNSYHHWLATKHMLNLFAYLFAWSYSLKSNHMHSLNAITNSRKRFFRNSFKHWHLTARLRWPCSTSVNNSTRAKNSCNTTLSKRMMVAYDSALTLLRDLCQRWTQNCSGNSYRSSHGRKQTRIHF